jgi:hypothetical protein
MKVQFARLHAAALAAIACASSAAPCADDAWPLRTFTLAWAPPTQNIDGTALTDLQGYYIYVGDAPDAMLPLYYMTAASPTIVLGYNGPGLRYFAVSAVNWDGIESDRTDIIAEPLE